MTVYDGENKRRADHIRELTPVLGNHGEVVPIPALHRDPLGNVSETVRQITKVTVGGQARLTIDASTYTRKHLLQLMYGLDRAGLLSNTRFLYSQPSDYHTIDNEPIAKGIGDVSLIPGFVGSNRPSKDRVLILFLSYEGRRALALWEYLESARGIVVIADPPVKPEWSGRTEEQNKYLMSMISPDCIRRSSAAQPGQTEELLEAIAAEDRYSSDRNDFHIAPLGTRAQLIGIYRFWRRRPSRASLVYASPGRYRDDQREFEPEAVLLLDNSSSWPTPGWA